MYLLVGCKYNILIWNKQEMSHFSAHHVRLLRDETSAVTAEVWDANIIEQSCAPLHTVHGNRELCTTAYRAW